MRSLPGRLALCEEPEVRVQKVLPACACFSAALPLKGLALSGATQVLR
jgi:hypothetical protein